jgi:uncharacterized protein YihD (DUF1040 family)
MKNDFKQYNTIALLSTSWTLNPSLSLVEIISKAAEKAGYPVDKITDCSDEDLFKGLEGILSD